MSKQETNNEARFEGVNWDEDWKPKVQMHAHGNDQPVRKVLTKGVREVYCDEFVLIKKLLRQGFEVQLREPGAKDSFLRVYPLLGTDLKTMYARAQAMLPLSTCIADKKVKMVFRGKEYTKPEDASAAIDETRYALPPRERRRERRRLRRRGRGRENALGHARHRGEVPEVRYALPRGSRTGERRGVNIGSLVFWFVGLLVRWFFGSTN